ncbi:membrane protein, partial [Bacillus thuringiensis]|nr:membrane protein [Bacillus thuringiensis]
MPKLLFTHLEEVKMLSILIGSNENSVYILKIIGVLEIIFGVVWLLPITKRKLFILHIIVLLVLTLAAGFTNI